MTFTQPEQRVRTVARRVREARAVPMKAAAIIIALGIVLIVTMGPAPASAQTTVVRECGDHYVVTRYNQDGSVKGVWNKQLSDEGTIYTGGKTWKLVEGNPDRFVSDGGAQLQVFACDATPGSSTRGVQQQGAQGTQTSSTLVSNTGKSAGAAAAQFIFDRAQAFTTGSNSSGYTLTSVQLNLREDGSNQAVYIVTLHEDSSGTPSTTSLGTLTTTTALTSAFQLVQFDAPSNGISLDANKTYWVLIDVSGTGTDTKSNTTTSGDEDSGAAAGWSIANDHLGRGSAFTDWLVKSTLSSVIHIRVNGYANTVIDRLSEPPRGPLYVTYDGQQYEAKAFSAERGTLWDYFESECTRLRSVSDPYRDYSLRDADGRLIQARNGWKYVYVQNSQGDITGTRAMTISECTSNKLYQRQSFCETYADRQGPNEQKICPTYRTW